ncbi:hypothetical protein D3C75_1064150 [compost metagenome]
MVNPLISTTASIPLLTVVIPRLVSKSPDNVIFFSPVSLLVKDILPEAVSYTAVTPVLLSLLIFLTSESMVSSAEKLIVAVPMVILPAPLE